MKNKLAKLLTLQGFVFVLVMGIPPFLKTELISSYGITWQEVVRFFAPYLLVPFYVTLLYWLTKLETEQKLHLLFVLLLILWTQSAAFHNLANLLSNLKETTGRSTDLTYFMDEHFSHFFWYTAQLGIISVLLYANSRYRQEEETISPLFVSSSVISALIMAAGAIEGQSAIAVLIFSLLILLALTILSNKQRRLFHQPLISYFALHLLIVVIALTAWGIINQGFVQFSELNLI